MSCRRILRSASLAGAIMVVGLFARQVMAEDPPKLSYAFQKGHEYLYNVKVEADLPDEDLTAEGVYTYKITDAADSQFTLQASGRLVEKHKVKPGVGMQRGRMGPRRPPMPPHHFGPPRGFPGFGQPARPAGTTIGRQGNLIIEGRLNALPFLLGYAEMLIIEPFPAEAKAAWDTQTGLGVIERNQSSWHHIGPFSETEVAHGATERIDFSVLESTADLARISKKYALHTAPDANDSTQIDMTGNGEFAFDRKEGAIKSQTMKYEIHASIKNVNLTIPFTLNFRLLSEAEAAEYKKKSADDAAAAAEAARPKPLEASEKAQLLTDLKSGDRLRIMTAALRLSKGIRDDQPQVVSRALCRAMKANEWAKPMIMQALKIWAAPDAEATIVAAAKDPSSVISGPAVEALANFKSQAAAEAAGAALANQTTCRNAAIALKAMGSIAEPYVIPKVGSHDVLVRREALGVLAAIGGKKSLQALNAELPNAAWHEKDEIQKAIGAIEGRLEAGADDASAGGATTAAPAGGSSEPPTRTWHDVTGTYQIEATLVSSGDGKVTLKRTDGKEVTLPLAKLSAEDRAFVEKHAKPANPFE